MLEACDQQAVHRRTRAEFRAGPSGCGRRSSVPKSPNGNSRPAAVSIGPGWRGVTGTPRKGGTRPAPGRASSSGRTSPRTGTPAHHPWVASDPTVTASGHHRQRAGMDDSAGTHPGGSSRAARTSVHPTYCAPDVLCTRLLPALPARSQVRRWRCIIEFHCIVRPLSNAGQSIENQARTCASWST